MLFENVNIMHNITQWTSEHKIPANKTTNKNHRCKKRFKVIACSFQQMRSLKIHSECVHIVDRPNMETIERGHFPAVLQFCFNKLEKPDCSHRGRTYWTVAMVLRRYTQNDVIFPTTLFSLCHSLLPLLHHYFSVFLSPQCNLIRLDCPLATNPCGHMALCPLSTPLSPSPLDWFLGSWSGLIDLQQPYISAAVPLQLVAPVMPYSQINQSDPCRAYWSLSQKLETQLQIKVPPQARSR